MDSRRYLVFAVLAAVLSLSSCSGTKNKGGGGGGGGNAMLSVSISDTPPANTTVVSFTLPIIGISLTSSSGSQVSVFSPGTPANFELTRLQTDSDVAVTNTSVAAGTYTAVNVTVGAASGTFINNSGAAVGNCPAALPFSVCAIPSGVSTTITVPFNLTLTGGNHQWLDLDFNYNNAIVTTSGIGINMQQSGVLTATTTVPIGIPSGDFANVDDFTGRVTAVSSSSISLTSTVRGSLTATITGSTLIFDPQVPAQCTGGVATLACIKVGSVVSLQGVLTNTGTIVATSLDVIDASTTPADEVEGTIYPSTCNGVGNTSIGMIISDSSTITSGSPLAGAGFGTGVCLTFTTPSFLVDFGILTGQPGLPVSSAGFSRGSDLLAGQTVRAKITGAIPATGTNSINATATAMILRFSRLTGTFGRLSGTGFTINGLPTYITAFPAPPETQTYTNATLFEGAANVSSLSGTVSISALFYNPAGGPTTGPLQAAKVRQH